MHKFMVLLNKKALIGLYFVCETEILFCIKFSFKKNHFLKNVFLTVRSRI